MHTFKLVLALVLIGTPLFGQSSYPALKNISKPSPEPQFPDGFDTFTPPQSTLLPSPSAPKIAEWTRLGGPTNIIALTGSQLTSLTGSQAGTDTRFRIFSQTTGLSFTTCAAPLHADNMKAAFGLPSSLPTNSEYLVWPMNAAGTGSPVAINATEAWWLGPNLATRGDSISVYGRNLSYSSTGPSNVYIQKAGQLGTWMTVTAANPYKVDFTVPKSFTDGTYLVWVHNGHGGHYGWSGPLTLTINDGMPWTSQTFNVKDYGAKGDGVTDDEAAIEAAVQAAAYNPWSTVYLPAGTYMVSQGFVPPSKVRWLGDGQTRTFLKANSHFVGSPTPNARTYCLLFNDGGLNNLQFENMTIDANGNMNGYLPTLIHLRFEQDVRFINVTIAAKGYSTADFAGTQRMLFQNCNLIGGANGVFFGVVSQVKIDHCNIYGTNDVNSMLTWWGGNGVSCTNTTAQDYDNTRQDGWAQGRFFYGASTWGSNRDIYVGNCTTHELAVRPGYSNQNTGEQILWENGTLYSGIPTAATSTTVTFPASSFFNTTALNNGQLDAVIVNGTGLGQQRQIIACTATTITVSPAWNLPPDSSSTVIIAGTTSRCVIYQNTLQGKSDYATRATASGGVQPYGNSYDFIIDSNNISQVRCGIAMWGMSQTTMSPQSITCAYFNYIANNSISDSLQGFVGVAQAWGPWPSTDPYPGISVLANSCVNNTITSTTDNGLQVLATSPPPGDQVDLNVLDHNRFTRTPDGIEINGVRGGINNTLLYQNNVAPMTNTSN